MTTSMTAAETAPTRSKFRPAALIAYLAVGGRIVLAPLLFLAFVAKTNYMANGKVFIKADQSYFAYSQMDAVMVGGCTNCGIGCRNTFLQLLQFDGSALMSKPTFENLYTMSAWNYSLLSKDALELAKTVDDDPAADCMSGVDEWASPITTIAGDPQYVVDAVRFLNISVNPQQLMEVTNGIKTKSSCKTRWVLEAHIRLFKFQAVAHSTDYSSVPAADFIIFPEYTECRGDVSNDGIIGSKLALSTSGTDLLAVVPEILTLFPYAFTSTSLPDVSRVLKATKTIYDASSVFQPLLHAYYGACRVREVNTTGVYIEEGCTVNKHWENYGLMVQSPDDLPVCSTKDVCVHNYYNSLWEFVGTNDTTKPDRFGMIVNVFRNRYADSVELSVLPGMVVLQILFMGMISLYQTMSHMRSVLLTQIWAYRCQNGRMQVWYLAQIAYHLAYNSDLYYLGLTTGTLSIESVANLTLCFFAFSYSFVNLLKARSGEQRLDRHFRLTWEIMQLFTTATVAALLYQHKQTSISQIMTENGELLRKTTARGAKYCNLSDSCIVFTVNLGVIMALAALVLGIIPFSIGFVMQRQELKRHSKQNRDRYVVHDSNALPAPDRTGSKVGSGSPVKQPAGDDETHEWDDTALTSFEQHCLGVPFTRLFHDCDDFAHVMYRNKRCSSVEAVYLTGFLYYGKSLYQAPAVMLLLVARLVPRKMLRTFNVVLIRWHIDELTNSVGAPSSCTWYAASAEQYKLTMAVSVR